MPATSTTPTEKSASATRLPLTYNSKVWDYEEIALRSLAVPTRRSNAGMGWLVSLGRIITPENSTNTGVAWVQLRHARALQTNRRIDFRAPHVAATCMTGAGGLTNHGAEGDERGQGSRELIHRGRHDPSSCRK